jgi:ubiquinone/menaquinone biosynthesis C-methylase UbiE
MTDSTPTAYTQSAYIQSERYRTCQRLFDRAYPNFRNAGEQYRDLVADAAPPQSRLLDVGCGRTSLAADAIRRVGLSYGVDLSFPDLQHNDTVTYPIYADAGQLPFPDGYFDVLISQWVVEHFSAPEAAFREMARVLRPGGSLVFMTTNANNYIPLISRLVPEQARDFALHTLLRRPSHESFPTFYRTNTRRAITRVGAAAGLRVETIRYVGNPFYFAFNVPLFRLALLFERITDAPTLNALKLYLLAVLRKT